MHSKESVMCQIEERKQLKNVILGLMGCMLVILLCYLFLDKPIAFAMAHCAIPKYQILLWSNQISLWMQMAAFGCIILLGIKAVCASLGRFEKCLFTLSLALAVAVYLKDILKRLFGRFWPETWYYNNPSLLKDGVYGFHFWQLDSGFAAFPSGHTTIVFCAMTFLWVLAPKWRWLAVLLCVFQSVLLIAFNYHFLGDVLAGAFLGSITAIFALHFTKLKTIS